MPFQLTDEQLLTRDAVRQFAEAEIAPIAAEIDRDHRPPLESIPKLAELGLLGLVIPEEYGGTGADSVSFAIAIEELSRVCGTHGVLVEAHSSLCTWPIVHHGNAEQKQKYLPALASGEAIGAFGLTEPGAGSDAAHTATTAQRDGDDFVLNGQKIFITNGGFAKTFVVIARSLLDVPGVKGLSAFIVERDTPGFQVLEPERKMGIRGSSTTPLAFSDCRVPAANLLGREGEGFKIAMQTLDGGRTGIAAQAVGIAQGAFEAACAYAKERVQFGQPIAALQAIQWMIADMAVDLEAGRALVYQAADLESRQEPHSQASAMAKLFCGEMATRVTGKAIQIHGGVGYTEAYPVERMYRDAKITEIYEGTSEIQRLVIARQYLR
ncbi:MAG: acyl-CoA dehydrogenase family protein [Propionibacteriaceae bacterium]|jgi:alkylation response protein AidB-like acyl-CoA dehydrogenase|nr:acyl-CoA dehydrogenase family protein [Propionibacteriaceae bacterium]